ncbi:MULTISPECIES: helix-turn-helix domain-containing protein [Enterococcus]|uniref:helix-turn-helix domain-containing protein n=1 Tax=Enterococcus TaxID=1350 RepID=UPI0006699679|nr:helix-turn-helix transcriptional regulator [Enterococcus faecalis]
MNAKDRIKQLAIQQKITIAELERKLNIANGTIGKWDKQNPSIEPLKKLADYFNVTTDYLLGRDTSKLQKADPEEEKIITMFRKNTAGMTEEEKREFNESMDKLMNFAKDLFEKDRKSGK